MTASITAAGTTITIIITIITIITTPEDGMAVTGGPMRAARVAWNVIARAGITP